MPLTSSMGSHTHTVSAEAKTTRQDTVLASVYFRAHHADVAEVGLQVLQDAHRAALSLLGVTVDCYRIECTGVPGWVGLELTSHDPYASTPHINVMSSTSIVDELTAVDTNEAVKNYIAEMCNDDDLTIASRDHFGTIAGEYMLQQQRRVMNQINQEYHTTTLPDLINREQQRATWEYKHPLLNNSFKSGPWQK